MTVTDTYLERIGSLIRDARRHKGLTQSELARSLGTSQSAVARIEQGKQNLSLEILARIGESARLRVRLARPLRSATPAHRRRPKLHGAIDVKTSKNAARGPAVRLPAQPGPHDAAQPGPHRGGQPDPRGAALHRRAHPLDPRQQRPGDRPADAARPGRHRRRRRPPHPDRDHVPRAAAARLRRRSSCRMRGAATSAPAPSSPTCARCATSASTSSRPTGSTRRRPTRRAGRPGRSCSPSAATPSPRTPSWPPRGTTASPSSATPARTTWSRTCASSSSGWASGSRASAPPP